MSDELQQPNETPEEPDASIEETDIIHEDDLTAEEDSEEVLSSETDNDATTLASDVAEADINEQPAEVDLSELNLSVEDQTQGVDVILEADLAELPSPTIEFNANADTDEDETVSSELNISTEAETEPISVLSEDDLALLEETSASTKSEEDDEEDEIIVKDYLNEDDGEPLGTPDYLKPPEPEWKLVARQLREEREAKRQALIDKRRQEDQRVIQERKARMEARDKVRAEKETEFRKDWEKRQQEKTQAVTDMMQRIREEREQKRHERAETDEREFGRKFTYPKPSERKTYPKPSELKRMEREQPKQEVDLTDTKKLSPPPKPKADDIESRVSRLRKPDTPETSTPDDTPDDDKPSD